MTIEPAPEHQSSPGGKVDFTLFGFTVALIVLAAISLALFPDSAARNIQNIYSAIAENLGIFYQWAAIAVVGFMVWIALSRYGTIRLGRDNDEPEFSLFSWVAMLFCAGIGAGLLYWASIEWAMYINAPPYGVEPNSVEAIEWATSYGLFHWGIAAWCLSHPSGRVIG